MTLQETLFFVGVGFVSVGVILAGIAVLLFFRWNIPDIRDDLNGTKRAEGIQLLENESASKRRRRKGKNIEALNTTGDVTVSSPLDSGPSLLVNPNDPNSTSVIPESAGATSVIEEGKDSTTVMDGGISSTSVLGDDEGDTSVLDKQHDDTTTMLIGPDIEQELAEAARASAMRDAAKDKSQAPRSLDPNATNVMKALDLDAQTQEERHEQGDMRDEAELLASSGFELVRKIVLTDSREFVQVIGGE